MSGRFRILALAAVTSAAFACAQPKEDASGGAFRPLDVGAAVPLYVARTIPGDTVRVGGTGAPTVLNVWATWCTSCREEMAALDSLKTEFSARGVKVVGVSIDEGDIEKVRRFAESNHLGFTVAHDPAGDIQRSYQVVGVPTTFIVGKDGTLLWRHTGNIEGMMPEVRAQLEKATR